ncbi:hypothetical protein PTSG_08996 [Salpingoeca rosetta]|uniref:Uncharacterized protein n=2 Tax=Salpingoeca rosetta (strain ATCC 50818 / BSB-021) TaxID=946362 RepID=F2ULW9_SALR5|nr:uncharacterized protein PTSG_08996 [Salpingoeca rosetta]EGD78118.1 hypothetical protein PTSG_08996 [Salpingoeca rosetta]|eukprot:XP_004989794.1 hypothetical protein PTSG_08996 [Salpingoeca rosetta]
MSERARVEQLMQRIADDTLEMPKRVKAAYDLWNTANNSSGSTAILDLGYPGELLNIYDTLSFQGRESLKARMVGILCCLAANLPLEKAEQLYAYDVQSRLFELRCSTDPVRQPINALCGLINLLHHHGDHPMMHGDVQLYTLTAKAHKGQPPQNRRRYFEKLAWRSTIRSPKNPLKTNLTKAAEYQAKKARSSEAASYARLALFNQKYLEVPGGGKTVNRDKPSLQNTSSSWSHQQPLPKDLEKIDAKKINVFDRHASAWDDYEANVRKAKVIVVIAEMNMQLCICSRCLIRYAEQLKKPIVFLQLQAFYEPRDWILEMSPNRKFFRLRHDIENEDALMRRFGQTAIGGTDELETVILEEAAANISLDAPGGLKGSLSVNVKATLDVMVVSMVQQLDLMDQIATTRLDAIDNRIADIETRLSKCEGAFARGMVRLQT